MVHIYTPDQVMRRGLLLAGMNDRRQKAQKRETNIDDFKSEFGSHPLVVATIWEDLSTTDVAAARIDTGKYKKRSVNLKNFLRTLHFLKRYPTERERRVRHGNTEKTIRKWCRYFLTKIVALKAVKIVWPAADEWLSNFIISVDGVHCSFHEKKHPDLSKDPTYYSWKYNGPGLSYELALSLFESKLVWVRRNPTTKAPDRANFVSELRDKIPDGKKAIADRGYRGKGGDPKVAVPNSHDTEELRIFKARARMRQENFHSRVKRFNCLTKRFNHDEVWHQACFEACCVICCYEMELISPLFDV